MTWQVISRTVRQYGNNNTRTQKAQQKPPISNAQPGKAMPTPYVCADTWLVPLRDILTNEKLFQNRTDSFSMDSVDRIVQAVENNTFKWQVFDPILLWQSPTGKLFVLSGHSRFEAFNRLSKINAKVQGKDFNNIPAKIINVPEAEAVRIALMSNTLSTPESVTERAIFYRQLLQNGTSTKEVTETAKMYEGKNAIFIINIAYLDPNGKTFNFLRRYQRKSDTDEYRAAHNIANWIGEAKRAYPLTNSHENELFNFLTDNKTANAVTNKKDFLALIYKAIYKNTEFGVFDHEKPLNLKGLIYKSYEQQQYEQRLREAKKNVDNQTAIRDKKRLEWIRQGANPKDIEIALKNYNDAVADALLRLQEIEKQAGRVQDAEKQSKALFGISGHRKSYLFFS